LYIFLVVQGGHNAGKPDLEYSGISLNMENSDNSQLIQTEAASENARMHNSTLQFTVSTSLQRDNHIDTTSLNFYRLDALPDVQPTVLKH